ncbi:SMP-30/gluconolactonase/LRE family protein [Ferviditalea candida]|uniref:Regucalcin n=1 Tax=Ferviditalea candida TaxID=3108399 RepID=A0ABU5ZKC1_9BACL|nr:SMP-30/gluconolactonase/LRE family protein [Paenibacillaceae bacterium T2]
MYEKLELVIDAKATLGEGPCWDANANTLYWTDIVEQKVHMYHPLSDTSQFIQVGQYVSAVVPRQSGGLVLAMHRGFYFYDFRNKQLTPIADPEQDKPGNRFNDGKCDVKGRFWAGTMNLEEQPGLGAFYCLSPDKSVTKMLDSVSVSNGIAWSSNNKTMYYIDTPTRAVTAFDFDLDSGSLARPRQIICIPEGEGLPDGMTIDEEGMLWIAHWDGAKVSRWNPETGECLEEVPVPASKVTSCAFGGSRMDELYITTARKGLSEAELREQPHAGGLFCIKTSVKGTAGHSFSG